MSITLDDKIHGQAQIDFGQSIPFSSKVARAFVMNTLTEFGAELPGVDEWEVSVTGNSILLEGDMSQAALRRILSLLEIPSTKFSSLKDEQTEESTEDLMPGKIAGLFSHGDKAGGRPGERNQNQFR